MENIVIKNQDVLSWMDETSRLDKIQGCIIRGSADQEIAMHACSDAILRSYLEGNVPYEKIANAGFWHETVGGKFFNEKMLEFFGNTRWYTASYVPNGFIGWHEDTKVTGYFLMFSYSKLGNGFFKYLDITTNEIIKLPDIPGWVCRSGFFGNDQTDALWHCASSDGPRWTWAYVWDIPEQLQSAINKLT